MNCEELEMFKNLTQCDWDGVHYDFHNDFYCTCFKVSNKNLILVFERISDRISRYMIFSNAELVKLECDFASVSKNMTIDNIYKGRFEIDQTVAEISNDKKCYFYLEFNEGVRMEFFSDSVIVQ